MPAQLTRHIYQYRLDHCVGSRYLTTQRMRGEGLSLLAAYRIFAARLLPNDAHIVCTGKVFISITVVTAVGGLRNQVVSVFESRQDLIDCCIASCQLPFIACQGFGWRYRGALVMDGGFTNDTPLFTDRPEEEQLVFRLSHVRPIEGVSWERVSWEGASWQTCTLWHFVEALIFYSFSGYFCLQRTTSL